MPHLSLSLPAYHAGQKLLRQQMQGKQVTVAIVGRRWGKTFFAINEIVEDALDAHSRGGSGPRRYGWFAPSIDAANRGWDEFDRWFSSLEARSVRSERFVELLCGCRIYFLSAASPASIRGHGFHRAVIDEGAWILAKVYERAILPTLADEDGPLLIITTPAGRKGWVWEEWCRAVKGEPGYLHFNRPSIDNPNPKVRIYIAKRKERMSKTAYDQEFLGLFTEDEAALFRGIDNAVGGMLEQPAPQMAYLSGADLGKSQSWTVQYTARVSGGAPYQIVNEDRFQLMDWPDQVRRAKETCYRYNGAPLVVDATGVGDAVLSMMRDAGMAVRGVKILPAGQPTGDLGRVRRHDLLDELALKIANGQIRVPKDLMGPETQLRVELESFAVDIDDEGRTKYRSRSGNTDCVFGLALLAHGLPKGAGRSVTSGQMSREEIEDLGGNNFLEEEF